MLRWLLICTVLGAAAAAQTLRIESGLTDEQVVGRNAAGTADLVLAGSAWNAESRMVEARLILRGVPAEGFDWRAAGQVRAGRWSATIRSVPTGGPYRVEVRVAGAPAGDRVSGVLVGDLWLLAGQSDMEGRGYLREALAPNPLVHSFDMRDHWLIAEEPLHTRIDAADRVYWFSNEVNVPQPWRGEPLYRYLRERDRGTGLGLPFAIAMLRRTGVPIGLVPCALGGTSMDQWSPALQDRGGDSLYGATLRRVRAAGGRLKGVLWSQGQADATPSLSGAFRGKFEAFVSALRRDLGRPDLPFYYVQIGRLVAADDIGRQWNEIQEAQRRAESAIPRAAMVATVDESLVDLAHADAASLKRLGVRLAKLACRDLFPSQPGCAATQRGPRPLSATYREDTTSSDLKYHEKAVKVNFASVNGRLRANGRISGFSVHAKSGGILPIVYAVDVDPDHPDSILIRVTERPPAGAVLHYGYGLDPFCNVVDDADLPLPAFGPLAIR